MRNYSLFIAKCECRLPGTAAKKTNVKGYIK